MENKLKEIMAVVFEVLPEEITNETSADNLDNWDSIRHLNLVVSLEEEFDIEFDDEEIINLLNYEIVKLCVSEKVGV